MKLVDDWRTILRKAWSLKFIWIIALLNSGDLIAPLLPSLFPLLNPWKIAFATIALCAAASIARLIPQKGLSK